MEKESSDKAEHSKDAIRCIWWLGGLLLLQFADKQGRPRIAQLKPPLGPLNGGFDAGSLSASHPPRRHPIRPSPNLVTVATQHLILDLFLLSASRD